MGSMQCGAAVLNGQATPEPQTPCPEPHTLGPTPYLGPTPWAPHRGSCSGTKTAEWWVLDPVRSYATAHHSKQGKIQVQFFFLLQELL